MKRKRLLLLFGSALALAAAPLITSCSDDDGASNGDTPAGPNTFNYMTHMVGSSDGEQILLDSITAGISKIESSASWITATSAEPVNGHPVLQISSRRESNETAKEATVTVTADNGDRAIVTVRHTPLGMGDAYDGTNASFMKEWWKCSTVQLNGIAVAQGTPWVIESSPHIPDEVRVQYTPTKGWEMAFCYLNDASIQGVRFFALYNKWTGQLRIYTYVKSATGWGSSLDFKVYFGTANSNDMFPCYHIFQYGIPSNHILGTSLNRYAKLVSKQNQTFCTWLSPYMASSSISPGWYVMETDLSAYVPKGKPWLKEGDAPMIKIFAETSTLENVTLNGTLTGSVSGTFSNPEVVQSGGNSALSGICNVLNTIDGMTSKSITNCNTYGALMSKNGGDEGFGAYLNPMKYWGGFACGVAAGGLSMMSDMLYPVTVDTIPGKIDLTLDAALALEGYISSYTGNDLTPLAVSTTGIRSAQGDDGHMGKGIWGLADDPVVYIDKDDLMSTMTRHKMTVKEGGGYTCLDTQKANLRIVYAFDPTSVKVNLNRDLYPEVYDMAVTTTVGVYTDRKTGNTDAFRNMLMLDPRPSFSLTDKTSGLFTLNVSSKPAVWPVAPDDVLDNDKNAYETPSNSSIVAQADGSNLRFYGRSIQASAQSIMVEPQVYVPYDGSTYTNPIAPDFVVTVTITFYTGPNHDDNALPNMFSKTFIPKIILVSRDDMKTVKTRIQSFSGKCLFGQSVATLANDNSVPVYFPGGDKLVAKCLRMLKNIGL